MDRLPLPSLEEIDAVPAEALPVVVLQLAALQSRAAGRLLGGNGAAAPTPATGPERLLTVPAAAARCGMSADWLYRHKASLPFIRRLGRTVRVSEPALVRWMASRGR
jgi:predicted DNA-binding transcriptional regulator AlpA